MTDSGPLIGRGRRPEKPPPGVRGALEAETVHEGDPAHAVLVSLSLGGRHEDHHMDELVQLAASAGLVVQSIVLGSRQVPDPRTFVGSGKLTELAEQVRQHGAGLVVVNHDISPAQERNLEKAIHCRVIDRTGLILDIFAQRARSHAGKLQVELAQLERLSTRLVRGWTHLERQKGGIGLRGPGETQLETDRRLLGLRVKTLKARLQKVEKTQKLQRRQRDRAGVLKISLVGYTNAGKSSLFNALTHAKTYTADQLFATLDTTARRIHLGAAEANVVLSDTVGFVRNLPHTLVAAFRGTLEETRDADLLVHVVDASDPDHAEHVMAVNEVLQEIGAVEVPQLLVYNKIDRLQHHERPEMERDGYGRIAMVWASALTGAGLDAIRQAFLERCALRDESRSRTGSYVEN